jgi:hypothetical protein
VSRAVQISNECEQRLVLALQQFDEAWSKLKAACDPDCRAIIEMLPTPRGYFSKSSVGAVEKSQPDQAVIQGEAKP